MAGKRIAETKMVSGRLKFSKAQPRIKFRDVISEADKKKKIPVRYNWGERIKPDHNWGDYGNLNLENCTVASAAHLIMIWKSYQSKRIYRPSVKKIIEDYGQMITGEPKGSPSIEKALEKGGEPVEAVIMLNYWRKKGIDNHKIIAFAKLTYNNNARRREELKRAIYLYGGCFIGINIPRSVERQWQKGEKWTVLKRASPGDGRRRLWFSHALVAIGYNENELLVVTFGKEETMSWEFYEKYVDEAYAVFDEKFLRSRLTPSRMKVADLRQVVKRRILHIQSSGGKNPDYK